LASGGGARPATIAIDTIILLKKNNRVGVRLMTALQVLRGFLDVRLLII